MSNMRLSRINLAAPVLIDVQLNGMGLFKGRMHGFVREITERTMTVRCYNPASKGDPLLRENSINFHIDRVTGTWLGNAETLGGFAGWRVWKHDEIEREIAAQMAGTSEYNHPLQERPEGAPFPKTKTRDLQGAAICGICIDYEAETDTCAIGNGCSKDAEGCSKWRRALS